MDRLPSDGILIQDRNILISVECERERPWDRSRRHIESMGIESIFFITRKKMLERFPLFYAKSMLLIDDHESERCKSDRILNQRMCPEEDFYVTPANLIFYRFFFFRGDRSSQKCTRDAIVSEKFF